LASLVCILNFPDEINIMLMPPFMLGKSSCGTPEIGVLVLEIACYQLAMNLIRTKTMLPYTKVNVAKRKKTIPAKEV
jgi:hypothetical protein